MIRNLKALGLALCAVFVFGALSASAASAATDVFTSPVQDTYVTGTQVGGTGVDNLFGTKWASNVNMECATAKYTGTFLGTTVSEVEVTPSYTECLTPLGPATVDDEGCKYVFTGITDAFTNTNNQAAGEDATVSLNCEHTGQIRITYPFGCITTLKDTHNGVTVNKGLKGVRYVNEFDSGTGKWDIKIIVTVDKIAYTSNANCGLIGAGTATDSDGFLTQTVTVKGYSNPAHTTQTNLTIS